MRFCALLWSYLARRALGAVGGIAAQSGQCTTSAAKSCSADGSSSTYTETIVASPTTTAGSGQSSGASSSGSSAREIRASGCPNNNPFTKCVGSDTHPASVQDWSFSVPAAPKFIADSYTSSLQSALSLQGVDGIIGIAINGVEIRSCYVGAQHGYCVDNMTAASRVEANKFEYCGGHGNPYHYHQVPSCLLQQLGPRSDASSPQIGWAVDGFPIYGNRGPNGELIKRCGVVGAHPTHCADKCGGYYGTDWNDDFLYRYFLMGPESDYSTNPISTSFGSEYFPYSPHCLLGCGTVAVSACPYGGCGIGYNSNPPIVGLMQACTGTSKSGVTAGYVAQAITGMTAPYQAQQVPWSPTGVTQRSTTIIPSGNLNTPGVTSMALRFSNVLPFALVLITFALRQQRSNAVVF